MNLLQQFINFLINQGPKRSLTTVKNYKADVNQFINWFEKEFNSLFDPAKITSQIIDQYKKSRNLSPNSIKRHVSSLHKFFSFLKAQKVISQDPLEKGTVSAEALAKEDPWMLRNFKSFLYEDKKSNLTIKNYINDMKSFFAWLTEVALVKYAWNVADKNLLNKINFSIVQEYKQRLIAAKFSPLTINRKLSSLRSYIDWGKNQGLIPSDQTSSHPELVSGSSPAGDFLRSNEMLKQVQHDKKEYSPFPPARLVQKSFGGISSLFDYLFISPLAQTIETTQYLFWKATGKKIFKKTVILSKAKNLQDDIAGISNIKREFYAPLSISTHYLPLHKRVWHYIRYVRPNWYKQYHSYSFTHYFHFAILVTLCSIIGFGIYNHLFASAQRESSVLGTTVNAPPRILSFQGKLTDSSETPITKDTNILFSLYDSENASSAGALWQEQDTVKPDSDGIFSVLLGKKTAIPDTAFSQNSKLFLGITIGNTPELRPRQELATVPFAANSETLQGLEPITNSAKVSNVVLALDSSGNLSIAGAAPHTFQTIGGNLILSGKVLSLTTAPGSNSNVQIVPDGRGIIDLSKPIQNSTNYNNLASAVGSVEFDDTVAILATTSAQAALYINQNSTGALISASTSGAAKFVVENDGTGKFTGDLVINGGDLTSTATTFNLLNSAATNLNINASGGTTIVKSNLTADKDFTLSSLSSNGGILYTNASGKILQATAGSSSQCLLGGTTPSFGSCSSSVTSDVFWNSSSGALYAGNNTLDLLIGATATTSAKFAILNINSGIPVASIAGTLSLGSASGTTRTIGATAMNPLQLGDSSTGDLIFAPANSTAMTIKNNGNIGIGTTTPLFKLDIADSQSATAAAQIFNTDTGTDADGLIIKLGNTNPTVDNANHFISFETSGIGIVGSIRGNGTGIQYQTDGIADFAEYFKKDQSQSIPFGSVVCLQNNGLVAPCDSNNNKIMGIASERPAFLGGKNLGEASIAVGLTGQVEALVSTVNGEIKAGDVLTASDIPGVAMKTTTAGQTIGKALEDLSTIDESKIAGYFDPDSKEYRSKADLPDIPLKPNIMRIFKIPVLINVSWHDPEAYLAQNGTLIINSVTPSVYSVSNSKNETLTDITGFFEVVAANIKTGLINASEIVTNTLVVTSDSIIVNGQSLKDYIVKVVKDSGIVGSDIISPVVKTDQLFANIISPLASDSAITINGKLVILSETKDLDSSPAQRGQNDIALEIKGSASISGNLNASDASISGTLKADKIIAGNIEGLEKQDFSFLTSHFSSNFIDLASYSAQLSYVPDISAERAQFNQGLMVFGATSLADLSVAGTLSIGGTMFVTENSIETLGTDLSLQSLRQGGLSIMGGLVYIDTEGNIKVQGDLSVSGKLAVNIISPLPSSDLVVNNASGSSILSVNQAGDVVASGSGTFVKLNLSFVQPVLAVSATEVIASSSAGITSIAPYQSEITIRNALVTDKSVIYITPVGTPSAQTPFLMRQVPDGTWLRQQGLDSNSLQIGSFTVGVQSPTNRPIDFNWLIVN